MYIKIGTRKSKLALVQTKIVQDLIFNYDPAIICEVVPIVTSGDLITDKNLYDCGGKALFLKELEQALYDGKIDIAVHSLKDVPGILPPGLEIAAVLEREDPREVFVSKTARSIEDLRHSAVVGTSSIRRKVLLQQMRPDLQIVTYRGNVDSRIARLDDGKIDATVLAASGLNRLGLSGHECCVIIEPSVMLPGICQGIIGVEIRSDDSLIRNICDAINHQDTWNLIQGERAFVEYLNADCKTPLSAFATKIDEERMSLECMLADFAGKNILFHRELGDITNSRQMGLKAAEILEKRLNEVI